MMPNLKRLIRLLLPPLLLNIIKGNREQNTFEGVYGDFSEIPDFTAYDSDSSITDGFDEVLVKLNKHQSGQFISAAHDRSQITNLLSLLIASASYQKFSVLDYGGGIGSTYIDCLNSINMDGVEYHIFDLPETMEMGRKLFPKTASTSDKKSYNIYFVDDILQIETFDIINMGSVLQYLPDYSTVLLSLIKKKPEYFLITDNFMGDHATFATAQVNMPRRRMAYWVFQLNEIVTLFEKNSYRLQYKSTNYQPFHNFNNFPVEYRINDSCNLLFEKAS
jgi:putative methyltransferase (TIGR04325 family)